jgi:phage host-nuclease inhibitor protein Gam
MTRTSITTTTTRGEYEQLVDTVAQLQLDLRALELERDEAKERVLAQYEARIKSYKEEIKNLMKDAQGYAKEHWQSLAPNPKAKTHETAFARAGFRTGQPTLKLLSKGKRDDCAMQLYNEGHHDLVDVVYTLNIKACLRALRQGLTALTTRFKITQTERFYVEPKAED